MFLRSSHKESIKKQLGEVERCQKLSSHISMKNYKIIDQKNNLRCSIDCYIQSLLPKIYTKDDATSIHEIFTSKIVDQFFVNIFQSHTRAHAIHTEVNLVQQKTFLIFITCTGNNSQSTSFVTCIHLFTDSFCRPMVPSLVHWQRHNNK